MHKEKKQNWYTNPKKYHFIYKTTCSVNGKYYYGMHSTDNLDDGYVGSGTRLWHSIRKHGIENFKLEILEFCSDRETLKKREAELITEDMLQDQMCMNLTLGGGGGWETVNKNPKNKNIRRSNMITLNKTLWSNSEWVEKKRHHQIKVNKKYKRRRGGWNGKTHSDKTKKLMSESRQGKQSGEKNSQFGTCWIYHKDFGNKKIKQEVLQNFLDNGWIKGRKVKLTN